MLLKIGSRGQQVKDLQEFLGADADGIFGKGTEAAVKVWQAANGLSADGLVGPDTWDAMGLATTDDSEKTFETSNGLIVNRHFLPQGEYKNGPTNKEYLFLHHTAGWNNPFNVIDQWGRDSRGAVATEFVLGGPSVKGNNDEFDGVMVQAFPEVDMDGTWERTVHNICILILSVLRFVTSDGLKTVKHMRELRLPNHSWLN